MSAFFNDELGTLYCDYNQAVLPAIPDESIGTIVTSPPYNIKKDYDGYVDEDEDYLGTLTGIFKCLTRKLRPDGSIFLNISGSCKEPYLPYEVVVAFKEFLTLQNVFHWIKSIDLKVDGDWRAFGHFQPVSSTRFVNDKHEHVFQFSLRGRSELDRLAVGVPYTDKSNLGRWKGNGGTDLRCQGNVWHIPYKTKTGRGGSDHPAKFPVELPRRCVLVSGRRGPVLDPFAGELSTAIACKALDVPWVCIEQSERYCRNGITLYEHGNIPPDTPNRSIFEY